MAAVLTIYGYCQEKKKIPDDIRAKYLDLANGLGFKNEKLLWISQDK